MKNTVSYTPNLLKKITQKKTKDLERPSNRILDKYSLEISNKAFEDLTGIQQYSFGESQLSKDEGLIQIQKQPFIGHQRSDMPKNYLIGLTKGYLNEISEVLIEVSQRARIAFLNKNE